MNWNFNDYLRRKLNIINNTKELGLNIFVEEEQIYTKEQKTLDPNSVYVVVKYLSNSITYEAKTQPIQVITLCEQDSINKTKELLDTFVNENNWGVETETKDGTTTFVKQQYTSPVIVSNFNEIGYGYRSVLYFSSTLYLMENVIDVKELEIDSNIIQPLAFNFNYGMTGNTQPVGNDNIAETVKNMATVSLSLTVPLISNTFTNKVLTIMNGTESGNSTFNFAFEIGTTEFNYDLKLTSAVISTTPNQVPSIQLGFMR